MGAYSVYIGENALSYDKELLNPNNRQGEIPPGETLISCRFDMSLNSAGSCRFVMPFSHPYYNEIIPMATEVVVVEIDNVIWYGRVVSTSKDFQNRMTVDCEGPLAYLNDSVQPYRRYFNLTAREYLAEIIDNHNAQVYGNRQFSLAEISPPEDAPETFTGEIQYQSTLRVIEDFISKYGGYIHCLMNANMGKSDLYWITDRNLPSAQDAEYGVNLLDLVRTWDLSDACTAIIPLGPDVEVERDLLDENGDPVYETDEQGQPTQDIAKEVITLPLRLDYELMTDLEPDEDGLVPIRYTEPEVFDVANCIVYTGEQSTYGSIVRAVTFEDAFDLESLLGLAEAWLDRQTVAYLALDVNVADLRFLDHTKGRFYVGMSVTCTSSVHQTQETLIITKIECDILKVSKKITLGHLPRKALTDIAGRGSGVADSGLVFKKVKKVADIPENSTNQNVIYFVIDEEGG